MTAVLLAALLSTQSGVPAHVTESGVPAHVTESGVPAHVTTKSGVTAHVTLITAVCPLMSCKQCMSVDKNMLHPKKSEFFSHRI